ncbi:MAG: gamma-glutamyl-gamma-aminobutyrate hydrolase family protein [Clostridia bacterium]|nr:gamma-glutamyl-gamma-aminobutyrate hydrolase family protein [Clostridia bacterium]MDD4798103.1 gamma-glutamyl-gamma-aminobutyrate hydrolase family protein [Clostridia bacterium]
MRPLIGITAGSDGRRAVLAEKYLSSVLEAGGIPIIVPILSKDKAECCLSALDGIIFSGGGDLAPHFFTEQKALLGFGEIDQKRDEWELALAREAYRRELPALGICRGLQVMCVALGGSLWQDLSLCPMAVLTHQQTEPKWYASHQVEVFGRLLEHCGHKYAEVNSLHHQVIKKLPSMMEILAVSSDGLIEAAGIKEGCFWGVQWHPEQLGRGALSQGVFNLFMQEIYK